MGKTFKGKAKAQAKAAAAVKKAKAKALGKAVKACVTAAAVSAAVAGCLNPGEQPSRSQSMNNKFSNCQFYVGARIDAKTVEDDESKRLPAIDMFTQAQASEGSETVSPTMTPTFDVSPKLDARYNDAVASASSASRGVLSSIGEGIEGVLTLMQAKASGTVPVKKTDGTQAMVKCENGECSFCTNGECSE